MYTYVTKKIEIEKMTDTGASTNEVYTENVGKQAKKFIHAPFKILTEPYLNPFVSYTQCHLSGLL